MSIKRPLNSWGCYLWPDQSSRPTRCSPTRTSAAKSAEPTGITSWPSKRTNRHCFATSKPFSPPTRPFPPYQQRQRDAARTRATSINKGHGRIERRTVIATTELTTYLQSGWPDLQQVYQITRERRDKGKKTVEVAYRITSLRPDQADAARLLKLDRGHWGIENGLHHVRDVTLGEDACRVRSRSAPQLLAAARNLALGLLRPLGFPSIATATRRIVMHPIDGLRRIISPS
jgi:predicted transposase YbfD/YdcC